jgi:hypothetical protein
MAKSLLKEEKKTYLSIYLQNIIVKVIKLHCFNLAYILISLEKAYFSLTVTSKGQKQTFAHNTHCKDTIPKIRNK